VLDINTNEARELLFNAAGRLGVTLGGAQLEQFMMYMDMLLTWRERFNLTAISDPREVVLKHFTDSLSVVPHIGGDTANAVDVGTGAGFPGIPLKLALPGLRVTLLDAVNKRVGFLNAVIEALELEDIRAVHTRAEDAARVGGDHREFYDLAVSRAVASLPALSEYALPFVRPGGSFVAMKGPSVQDELDSAGQAIQTLGGSYASTISVEIPYTDIIHSLVIISKFSHTPPRFPRKASQIAKRPIIR